MQIAVEFKKENSISLSNELDMTSDVTHVITRQAVM